MQYHTHQRSIISFSKSYMVSLAVWETTRINANNTRNILQSNIGARSCDHCYRGKAILLNIMSVGLHSFLRYPERKSLLFHAVLNLRLHSVRLYHISAHHITNGIFFWKKIVENIMCLLIYSTSFACNISHSRVFPCFFFSGKANARVYLAKTGHGPHSS